MIGFEDRVSCLRGPEGYFSVQRPVYISRAPGRLDLMGGNVDYTGGLVFQATIREATWAAAQRRNDGSIVFWNPQMREQGWSDRVEFELQDLSDEAAVR
ncbi:MAG TPA: galactokinase family protein, partial [Pyrinomonadaceae bacterium]|nr:galactokinase family protein [Pyrinomonadaceae bacterium]